MVTTRPIRPARDERPGSRRAVRGVLIWLALIAAAISWGQALPETDLYVGSVPPFIGHLHPPSFLLLPAVALAGLLIAVGPTGYLRWGWPRLLAAAWVAAACWAVALAASRGWSRVTSPLARADDYRPTLTAFDDGPGEFLRSFVRDLPTYSIHTRGHPPGPNLVVWGLERVGLSGAGWQAALVIAAGSSAVVAVAITVRAVVDERAARRALPFLVLAPTALWVATSMDALFLGVTAWGIACLAVGGRRPGPAGMGLCLGGGLLLGATAFLSYGLLPVGALAIAAVLPRPARALAVAAAGALAVVAAFTAAGFWWPSGAAATHTEWAGGLGAQRSYAYFLVGDLALVAVLIGPAGAAALARLRDRRLGLVVGAAALAILVSDLGGFSRGEVERIWLPYAPWLLAATAALPEQSRRWLAAQAALTLGISAALVSPW